MVYYTVQRSRYSERVAWAHERVLPERVSWSSNLINHARGESSACWRVVRRPLFLTQMALHREQPFGRYREVVFLERFREPTTSILATKLMNLGALLTACFSGSYKFCRDKLQLSNDCFKIMLDLIFCWFWVWLSVLGMGGYFWLGTRKLLIVRSREVAVPERLLYIELLVL